MIYFFFFFFSAEKLEFSDDRISAISLVWPALTQHPWERKFSERPQCAAGVALDIAA